MMGKMYVHKKYADRIVPPNILQRAESILRKYYPDFEYNCVCYNPKCETKVRFDESPDFNSSPEPEVGQYVNVDLLGNNGQGSAKKGMSHAIWHHKWMWVDDDYDGFNVDDSYNWSKKWTQKISNPSGIRKDWERSLSENDLTDGEY